MVSAEQSMMVFSLVAMTDKRTLIRGVDSPFTPYWMHGVIRMSVLDLLVHHLRAPVEDGHDVHLATRPLQPVTLLVGGTAVTGTATRHDVHGVVVVHGVLLEGRPIPGGNDGLIHTLTRVARSKAEVLDVVTVHGAVLL